MTAHIDIRSQTSCFEEDLGPGIASPPSPERLEIFDEAYQICKEYLKGPWEVAPKSEFQVSVLSGGLSNKLYVCKIPKYYEYGCHPSTVVLRIYGIIIQDFTAQIQESVVFSILSERKLGPKLFAVFPGGRLEEYLPCRALSTDDLSDPVLSGHIAQRLSCYHRMIMPVNKQPTTIMAKLQLYHENLQHVQFNDQHKSELLKEFLRFDILKEIDFVKKLIKDIESPVVFCHNDVQEGNLLYLGKADEKENPIQMIDFEYSCYNYRGFDIGNHFCEWMFDYSYEKWPHFTYRIENFPSKKQQVNFIKSYIKEHQSSCLAFPEKGKWTIGFMIKEANRFALLSHLFWGLWSVMQAKMSDIGFGYMEYAIARMDAYLQQKMEVCRSVSAIG